MKTLEAHRENFKGLSERLYSSLHQSESMTLQLAFEDQDYLRFNQSKVRQITHVEQARLCMRFQSNGRRVVFSLDLSGDLHADTRSLISLLARAKEEVRVLPEDPFLCPFENHGEHHEHHAGSLPPLAELLEAMRSYEAKRLDLAGLYAGGTLLRATSNSAGLHQSFSSNSFFLDYSLFTLNTAGDHKAVKGLYSGRAWSTPVFHEKMAASESELPVLRAANKRLDPSRYRVFFSPKAVDALIGMFSWGGVSYSAYRQGESALQKLMAGEVRLSPQFRLEEDFGLSLIPRFNSLGEIAPASLPIIADGDVKNLLISSRTAREYGVTGNQADTGEALRSPVMAPGDLSSSDILERLGTGLYVSNLHYLNWSDRLNARFTGMTRYACFWVEDGQIAAPIQDLRFDESLFTLFGSGLEAVTENSEIIMATDTYHQRALGGTKVPGMLVDGVRFTL